MTGIRVLVSAAGGVAVNATSQYFAYPGCSEGKNGIWKVGLIKTA